MKIAFFINTAAQVYFEMSNIKELEKKGHETLILARNYGETLTLLDELKLNYFIYSDVPDSKYGKILNFPFSVISAYRFLRKNPPDLLVGAGVYAAYTSLLLRKPCMVFSDQESTKFQFYALRPFVNMILTPSTFRINLGPKHVKIDTYKEFAYLGQDRFKPDIKIFDLLNIPTGTDFVLLRFNAFDAVHDVGIRGFNLDEKRILVEKLREHALVFISSELDLPEDLQKYELKIQKHRIHDVLHYAKVVVADTGTVVLEAAVLGTPAIRYISSTESDMKLFIELEKKYQLIFGYNDPLKAINKAVELVKKPNLKKEWESKRNRLHADKVDPMKFMVSKIENILGVEDKYSGSGGFTHED